MGITVGSLSEEVVHERLTSRRRAAALAGLFVVNGGLASAIAVTIPGIGFGSLAIGVYSFGVSAIYLWCAVTGRQLVPQRAIGAMALLGISTLAILVALVVHDGRR